MLRKMKKMLFVHHKIPKHCLILLPLSQDTAFMVTVHVKGQRFLLQKNPKNLLSNIFSLEIAPYIHNPPFIEWILIGIFFLLFLLTASVLLWLCLCFHFHALSILLHYEFSLYLLKVRATVHIFRIHGGVCGYRY